MVRSILPRLAPVQVLQVLDEIQERFRARLAPAHDLVDFFGLGVQDSRKDDVDITDDCGQGAGELVGDHADEPVLVALGLPFVSDVSDDENQAARLLSTLPWRKDHLEHCGPVREADLPVVRDARSRGEHLANDLGDRKVQTQFLDGHVFPVPGVQQELGARVHQDGLGVDVEHDHAVAQRVDELAGECPLPVQLRQVDPPIADEPALPRCPLDNLQEIRRREGLDQEVECAVPGHLDRRLDGGQRRDDDDHRVPAALVDRLGHLEPVDTRAFSGRPARGRSPASQGAPGRCRRPRPCRPRIRGVPARAACPHASLPRRRRRARSWDRPLTPPPAAPGR